MLYMIVNRTRTDLSPQEWSDLGALAQGFYDRIPSGITLHGDWAATDGSRTFALLEAESRDQIEALQRPFRRFVDMEVVAVERVAGWRRR